MSKNKQAFRSLCWAAEGGNLCEVQRIIKEEGTHLQNYKCQKLHGSSVVMQGASPIWLASKHGHLDVVRYLQRMGADLDKSNDDGVTPFAVACDHERWAVIRFLHGKGADIDKASSSSSNNNNNTLGESPFSKACQSANLNLMRVLFRMGANVNYMGNLERSCVWNACHDGNLQVVKSLRAMGADMFKPDFYGKSPFWMACHANRLDVMEFLHGNVGADLDETDAVGRTILFSRCKLGFSQSESQSLAVVDWLVRKGADIHKCERHGATPLFAACETGFVGAVKLLLARGADLEKTDRQGRSPFWIACQRKKTRVVQLLLLARNGGLDIDKADKFGRTPFWVVCDEVHALLYVMYLQDVGVNIHIPDSNGKTPFLRACQNGKMELAKFLFSKGADIHQPDDKGRTPLHFACRKQKDLELAKFLVVQGALVNPATISDGQTPLHWAVSHGCQDTVSMLAAHGARFDLADQDGQSPYSLASANVDMSFHLLQNHNMIGALRRRGYK